MGFDFHYKDNERNEHDENLELTIIQYGSLKAFLNELKLLELDQGGKDVGCRSVKRI